MFLSDSTGVQEPGSAVWRHRASGLPDWLWPPPVWACAHTDKIRDYRAGSNNRPSNDISFMSAVGDTSDLLQCELVLILTRYVTTVLVLITVPLTIFPSCLLLVTPLTSSSVSLCSFFFCKSSGPLLYWFRSSSCVIQPVPLPSVVYSQLPAQIESWQHPSQGCRCNILFL
jgi:hypothetical protein